MKGSKYMSPKIPLFRFGNNPKKYPLYAGLLTLLLYIIILSCCHIIGYDNNTLLSGDLYQQYIAFIRLFIDVLRGKGNLWYSFSLYLGSPTAATFAYYCLSPFNLLYLIPGISSSAMTIVVIILKHALAAICFQLFTQYGLKTNSRPTLLFSIAYALCGFAVTMQMHIMWLDAFYVLPILMLFLIRFVQGASFLPLIPSYAYLFITNFYMGYIIGIFSFLCFIALLFIHMKDFHKKTIIDSIKKGCLFAFSVLLAAGCCAAILLPSAPQRSGDIVGFRMVPITILDVFNNLFLGQMQSMGSPIPLIYCGLPALLFFPQFFLNKQISKKEKISAALILCFYLAATQFSPLYELLHAFDAPNWFAHRYAICISFLLLVISIRALPFIKSISFHKSTVYIIVLILMYAILIPIQRLELNGYHTNTSGWLLINTLFLSAYLFLLRSYQTDRRTGLIAPVITFVFCLELVLNGCNAVNLNNFRYHSEKDIDRHDQLEATTIHEIQTIDQNLYRIRVLDEDLFNAPSYHHYPGINSFASIDNENLRSCLSSLGIAAPFANIYDQGYTDLTDMLFGIRYEVYFQDDILGVLPVYPSLPIGFMASPQLIAWQKSDNPFINQNTLINALSGNAYNFFTPVPPENIQVNSCNMETYAIDDAIIWQHISDSCLNGYIIYSLNELGNKRMYAYFPTGSTPELDESTPTISGIYPPFRLPSYMSANAITEAARMEDGSGIIRLDFTAGSHYDYTVSDASFYLYDDSQITEAYEALSSQPFSVTTWHDGYLEGDVEATVEKPILFTTIPYDSGWQLMVDDLPATVDSVLDGSFLAFYLPPGRHHIVLSYEAPLAFPGLMVSASSMIFFLLLIFMKLKKKETQNEK